MKYIQREGKVKYHVPDMTSGRLPQEAVDIIAQCDAVLISARHLAKDPSETSDMDTNHRGGKPGNPSRFVSNVKGSVVWKQMDAA
jgi:hypothetical protein